MTKRNSISDMLRTKPFQNKPVEGSPHRKHDDEYSHYLFMEWERADKFVQLLESIRDANTPKTPDEKWNSNFCIAIEMLPEATRKAEECWLTYYAYRGKDI